MPSAPGPRPVPVLGHLLAFRRDRLSFLRDCVREHGDVVALRLGPYRVHVLAHPDHVRDVLVTAPGAFRKSPVLQRARAVLGDGLLTSEGEAHRRQRRVVRPAFHPGRLAAYGQVMVGSADAVAARWRAGEPVDVHAEMVRSTLGVAARALLGSDVEADVDAIEAGIDDLMSAYRLLFAPFGRVLQRLPVPPTRRMQRARRRLDAVAWRLIAEHERDVGDRGDLLSSLLAEAGGSRRAVRDQALTLLLAGHETTANALTFAWHLLARHPQAEARLHAEVDAVLAGRPPAAGDIERLPYARAVLAEALRLYPPSWAMARQVVTERRFDGHLAPAGSVVVMPQWVVHRDPRWWPDPERFEPGRWTGGSDRARPRHAYFPFGAGARQCIGESFAWTEGVLTLATVAARWRLRAVPDQPLRLDPLLTLRPRGGLWLRPEPRPATSVAPER